MRGPGCELFCVRVRDPAWAGRVGLLYAVYALDVV